MKTRTHPVCYPPKAPVQTLHYLSTLKEVGSNTKYLWVVVFASFECFIYETHTEVPLEPWGGWWGGTWLFCRGRLLSGRNGKFKQINIDSITYMQNIVFLHDCLTCLHLILCVSFSSDLSLCPSPSPDLYLPFLSHLYRLTFALVPYAVPALFLFLCPCVLY